MTYFEVMNIKTNPRAMLTPANHFYFFLLQCLFVSFESLFKYEDLQWLVIGAFLCLFGFYLFRTLTYCSYYNSLLLRFEVLKALIPTWSVFVLFITPLFSQDDYEGSIYLFLVGIACIVIFVIFKDFNKEYLLFYSFDDLSSNSILYYIASYLKLIEESSRKREVLIKGYIDGIEEKCTFSQCPLKRYLCHYEKNKSIKSEKIKREMNGFLYQNGQMLYELAISRFPKAIDLKIYYAIFIYDKLPTKKNVASNIIAVCKNYGLNLSQQFLLYRFKTLLSEKIKNDKYREEEEDFAINYAYNCHNNQFKNDITLVTSFYTEFWSVILRSNHDDFSKLNDYGTKISKLVEDLKYHFQQMLRLKVNNETQIFFYSQFLRLVLNDNDSSNKLLKKYHMKNQSSMRITDHNNFIQKDFYSQFLSEEKGYIFISSRDESFGIMSHASVKVCSLLGYTKNELIGKSLQLLFPDFVAKQALSYLSISYKKYLLRQCDKSFSDDLENNLTFELLFDFVINKSKYIIPICVQFSFVIKDEEKHFILVQLKENLNRNYYNNIVDDTCHILTNQNFVIQNFTSNCLNILKLTTKELNNTVEITSLIQEFHEEYLHNCVNLNLYTPEAKMQLKKHILETRFKNITNVSWTHTPSFYKSMSNYFKTNIQMHHEPLVIDSQLLGYAFTFVPSRNTTSSNLDIDMELRNSFDGMDLGFHIDKLFLPEAANRFALNPENMAFIMHSQKDQIDYYKTQIKGSAMKKIQQHQTQILTSDSVSSSCFSDSKSFDYSMSCTDSSLNDSKALLRSTKNNKIVNAVKEEDNGTFYHVDSSKIKYMIYNFDSKVIQEYPHNKLSQVEIRLYHETDEFKQEDNKHAPTQYPSPRKEKHSGLGSDSKEHYLHNSNDKLLNKQIHHALEKDEVIDFIFKMRFFTLFLFAMLLAIIFLIMMWIPKTLNNIEMFYELINKTENLIYNFVYASVYSRELTLISSGLYSPLIGDDKAAYVKNCTEEGVQIYNNSIIILSDLSQKIGLFSEEYVDYMTVENVSVNMIKLSNDENYYYTISYNLTTRGALYETMNAFNNLIVLPIEQIIPTNKYVFFFMNNTMNDITLLLYYQLLLYKREANKMGSDMNLNSLITLMGATVFCIIAYLMLLLFYDKVANQQNSFLQIFLEIDSEIISTLLKKSESFIKLIQTDILNDVLSAEDQDFYEDKLMSDLLLRKKTEKKRHIRKIKVSKEQKLIYIKILIFFIFYWLFCFVFVILLKFIIQLYSKKLNYYMLMNEIFWTNLSYFCLLREYLFFTDNVNVVEKPITGVLATIHQKIINVSIKEKEFSSNFSDLVPIEAKKVLIGPICTNYSTVFFKTYFPDTECNSILSNAFSYGLESGLDFFINQVLTLKHMRLIYEKSNIYSFKYNNTLLGTKLNDALRPPEEGDQSLYDALNSIGLIEGKGIKELTIVVLFVFRYFFDDFQRNYMIGIRNELKMINRIFTITISVFSAFIVLLFLFVWRPFENNLNKTMIKAKNILSIIPTEVLCQIKDIQKLLDINQSAVRDKKLKFHRATG